MLSEQEAQDFFEQVKGKKIVLYYKDEIYDSWKNHYFIPDELINKMVMSGQLYEGGKLKYDNAAYGLYSLDKTSTNHWRMLDNKNVQQVKEYNDVTKKYEPVVNEAVKEKHKCICPKHVWMNGCKCGGV
jgi:hypothetical protein